MRNMDLQKGGLMRKSVHKFVVVLFVTILSLSWLFSQSKTDTQILEKNKESVITFVSFGENKKELAKGSGFLIGKELLLTNYHLVDRAEEAEGRDFKGKKVKIEGIVVIDREHDLALLKVNKKDPILSFGNSEEVASGRKLFIVGGDESGTVTISQDEIKGLIEVTPYLRVFEPALKPTENLCGAAALDANGMVMGMVVVLEGRTAFILPSNLLKGLAPKASETKFKNWKHEDYFSTYEGSSFAGRVFLALSDTGKAQTYLEKAIKSKSDDMDILTLLGGIYIKQRNYSSAVSTLKKIMELDPNRDKAYLDLGFVYIRMMRWQDSIPPLEKALQLNLSNKEAYAYMGDSYRELKEYEKAAEAYSNFLKSNPESPGVVYQNLGLCQVELKQYEAAISSFQDALKQDPTNIQLNYKMAQACQEAGQLDRAAEVYTNLARLSPEDAKVYFNTIIKMYDEAKMPEKAVEAAKNLLEFNPKNADAIYNLGYLYVKQEKYNEAIETFKKVIEIRPDFEYAYANIGYCYSKLKKYKESIEAFQKLVEISPDNVDGWLNIGIGYMLQKKFDPAVEPIKKVIDLRPDYGIAYYNLAVCYLNLKDRYSAEEIYKKLLTIDPDLAKKLGVLLK